MDWLCKNVKKIKRAADYLKKKKEDYSL